MTTDEKVEVMRKLFIENIELTSTEISRLYDELIDQTKNLNLINEYILNNTIVITNLKERVETLEGEQNENP